VRIAVLGTYNSGSTIVAGVLHRLGVDLGPPFWKSSDDDSPQNYYESAGLAAELREWRDEPYLREAAPRARRLSRLAGWIAARERASGDRPVAMKHPLLALSAEELLQAWGAETRFIWAHRPLPDAIARLEARGWFRQQRPPDQIQTTLWDALTRFFARQPHHRASFADLKQRREQAVRDLARFVGVTPGEEAVRAAVAFIRS